MTSPWPEDSSSAFFSAINLKPVKVSQQVTPLASATVRAMLVVTIDFRNTGFSGIFPARRSAPIR